MPVRTRYRFIAALLAVAAAMASAWWAWQGRAVEPVAAPGGRVQCVSYAPSSRRDETLVDPGVIVSPERIERDLALLAERFDCVRTYSQGNGLAEVPRIARQFGLDVLMGVWISRDPAVNRREVDSAIAVAARDRDVIRGIIVGNEVLLRGEASPEALAAHIREVRQGTGLPVTYADVWEFWRRHRESLVDAVDFVTIHILPYWEDDPLAVDIAVAHVRDIHHLMRQEFAGREVLIGETGWPSAGRQRRGAVPGRVNQARFIREFLAFAAAENVSYNVIEAFDQPWKRRQEGAVGGYWGLYTNDRQEKFPLVGPVVEEPRWPWALVIGAVTAVLFVVAMVVAGPRAAGWPLLVMGLSGYVTGCILASQAKTAWLASRTTSEWVVAVTWTVLAVVTAWWLTRAAVLPEPRAARGWRPLRFVWLFSATIVSLLLVMDSRYRDFPLALFLAPVAALLLVQFAAGRNLPAQIEERILSAWLVAGAVVITLLEGVSNGHALAWSALTAVLGLSVWLHRAGPREA